MNPNESTTTVPGMVSGKHDAAPAKSPEERLAELQAKEEARQEERKAARASAQLERLEIIDRFEAELGPREREFVLVPLLNLGEGFIVLKRPTAASHKKFMTAWEKAKDKGRPVEETDVKEYVAPCVVHAGKSALGAEPAARKIEARQEYLRIANERPAVPMMCAGRMIDMVKADEEEDAGK